MTDSDIKRIENEIYTKLLMDEFRRQKAAGVKEYLIDKYEMDMKTKEELRKFLASEKNALKKI